MKAVFIFLLIITFPIYSQSFIESYRFGQNGRQAGEFIEPAALQVSGEGIIFIVDTGNNRIQLLSLDGKVLDTIGGFGFEPDQFDHPGDIWVRSLINIYVSDYNNQRVQRYDRRMNYISSLENNPAFDTEFQFREVLSCAVNSQQELFLLDSGDKKIIKFNREALPERIFGSYESGEGMLEAPQQLDLIGADLLAVSDAGRKNVLIFDYFGNLVRIIGHKDFRGPSGLGSDGSGNLLICDPPARKLFLLSADISTIQPVSLALSKKLTKPVDVAIVPGSDRKSNQKTAVILDGEQVIVGKLKY